ncbi:hypothetical protein SFMTTN_2664 [Sulfuriferula multivorans]|uniref:Uncharacterized protein n=1 Tax=Sulfuriferula multivorans TaxID=1559896 RepID=A0A401JGS7_9PROT|nr:hypothetical protein SFMTTN_2664 [Sulfuriferula multivorans]
MKSLGRLTFPLPAIAFDQNKNPVIMKKSDTAICPSKV